MGEGKVVISSNKNENKPEEKNQTIVSCVRAICVTIVILVFLFLCYAEHAETQRIEKLKLMIEAGEKGIEVKYEQ